MTRASKISAIMLAITALLLAGYALIGLARDLGGEICHGLWGVVDSCFSVMMFPVQILLPFALPIIVILAAIAILPLIRKPKK